MTLSQRPTTKLPPKRGPHVIPITLLSQLPSLVSHGQTTTHIRMQKDTSSTNPAFRPSKRRKFYRKRDDSDSNLEGDGIRSLSDGGPPAEVPTTLEELVEQARNATGVEHEADAEPQLSVTEILRRRRAARSRRGGIEFSNAGHGTKANSDSAQHINAIVLIEKDDSVADIKTVVDRFAPQTGQVADVDKHM